MERSGEHSVAQRNYVELDRKLSVALREARAGNSDLLGDMLIDWRPYFERIAQRKWYDEDAEDLLQQVFTSFLEKVDSFEDRGFRSFRGYLARILDNRIINLYRGENRPLVSLKSVEDKLIENGFEADTVKRLDAERIASDCLDALSIDQREVIILGFYQNLDDEEISHEMSSSIGVVRVRRHRALRKLRKSFSLD